MDDERKSAEPGDEWASDDAPSGAVDDAEEPEEEEDDDDADDAEIGTECPTEPGDLPQDDADSGDASDDAESDAAGDCIPESAGEHDDADDDRDADDDAADEYQVDGMDDVDGEQEFDDDAVVEDEDESPDDVPDDGDGDDSDEQVSPVRRRAPNRVKPDIPEDLLRRSSRARRTTTSSSRDEEDDADDDDEPSSESEADVPSSDEEEDDEGSNASDEFRRPRAAPRRPRPKTPAPPRRPKKVASESDASDSDSDREWGAKAKNSRRKRKKKTISAAEVVRAHEGRAAPSAYSEDADMGETSEEDREAQAREARKQKLPVDLAAEEETTTIERVISHRAVGSIAEDFEIRSHYISFEKDDDEYWIKWERTSYRKCSWVGLDELRQIEGIKGIGKVTNYAKRVQEVKSYLLSGMAAPEDYEELMLRRETDLNAIRENCIVERVVTERTNRRNEAEYLVKWENASYADCTWENYKDLKDEQDLIDAYLSREQNALPTGKTLNPFRDLGPARKPFKRIVEQPAWLHGGPEGRKLRDYQLEGLNFLAFSWCSDRNVILADEMGLGKTLQTISLIGWCKNEKNVGHPFLVVVPLSTMPAWQREFARWLPDLNVVCYQGDGVSRDIIRRTEFFAGNGKTVKFNVLLSTPELVLQDEAELTAFRFSLLAVDEAHRLKNEESSLHVSLRSFKSANRLLITGTPLQNSVRELWALLHFLQPDEFRDPDAFEQQFSFTALRNPDNIAKLHSTLRPYILRRQKGDVEKSLPKKSYAVLRVGMTPSQQQLYRWILTKNFSALNKARGGGASQSSLLNIVMELKKCCNHPYLFDGNEDETVTDALQALIKSAGKMVLLDKLLMRLREKGHRVLVFSQMVRMLDILQDYCKMRGFQWQRLDGSMPNDARQRAVDHYNAPDSTDFVFLLSTRAGGLGINLATADTVIIFDSDWNPQNDLQAESRAHRIGQTKDVKVFRFLTKDTVEEDILERAKRKRVLEHLIIHGVEGGEGANNANKGFKKDELSAILRFGAEQLFKTTTVEEGGVAEKNPATGPTGETENSKPPVSGEPGGAGIGAELDDIDAILARNPVVEETEDAPSVGDSLLSAFKWADFLPQIDEAEEEEKEKERLASEAAAKKLKDLEERKAQLVADAQAGNAEAKAAIGKEGDTDFWSRVIPQQVKEAAVASELMFGKRRRQPVKSYGDEDNPTPVEKRRKGTKGEDVGHQRRVVKALVAALMKFGDPARITEIMKEANVADDIRTEDASKLLNDGLDAAEQAVLEQSAALAQKSSDVASKANGHGADDDDADYGKKKGDVLTVDIGGEYFPAAKMVTRCRELKTLGNKIKEYDQDTRFRPSNQIKAASYTVRWTAMHDAMLLVGTYRHGFGNWVQIKSDKDLQLEHKISIPDNPAWTVAGAPEPTTLNRRVTSLIKSLEREMMTLKKDRKGKGKKGKAVPRDLKKNPKSGSLAKAKTKIPTSRKSRDAKSIMKSERVTLEKLRGLATRQNEKEQHVAITKECLLKLGQKVDSAAGRDQELREKLWQYVHDVGSCTIDAAKLDQLYIRLQKKNKARA